MTHTNRGRLVVDTNGNWRLYTNTIPANATALGTVTRDDHDTGALVRIEATGTYVQVNAGALPRLDGRKVAAALGTAGRPSEMSGAKKVNTYLDAESLAIARRLGNGNVSEGIRKALGREPEFDQFLSDVMTAAGLVTHGKQCKQLGERLGAAVMMLRVHGIKGGQHVD